MVVVAIALFATGRWPGAVGVLLSPFPVGAMALRLRRAVGNDGFKNSRPAGISIIAVISTWPGVILLFVENLIGGDFPVIVCTAIGTAMIGVSGLIIAMARSLQPT